MRQYTTYTDCRIELGDLRGEVGICQPDAGRTVDVAGRKFLGRADVDDRALLGEGGFGGGTTRSRRRGGVRGGDGGRLGDRGA